MKLKDFLRKEVKPALGCTEPGAVALAVARACDELSDREDVASVRVTVSSSIYKNGMAVGIPGTNGARGNAIAAALGAICGKASLGLEVLKNSTKADVERAEHWVKDERVTIYCDPDRSGVYVLASVFTPEHKSVCLVEENHSNIAKVIVDGTTVFETERAKSSAGGYGDDGFPSTLESALEMVKEMDGEDQAFILEGVRMNMAVADGGFTAKADCSACGACVQSSKFGLTLREMAEKNGTYDISMRIRSTCAAAADARMSGILMPVMSSAGSGNHGIAAILPAAMLGRHLGRSDREIAEAVAVSHIATSFVKRSMGRLSPVCGCSVAAGAGAAAGLAYTMGGGIKEISTAMSLLLANLAGMLCDGAKESCALKVSAAASEAYCAAQWAMSGQELGVPQGVFGASIEETVENIGRVTKDGMKTVDRVMIDILDIRHRPVMENL